MQNNLKAVIEEAIRELNITDEPDFYHRLRRWMRKNIKRQPVEPIDIMNWPKGCLMVGLMNQAKRMLNADTSEERALSLVAMSEVKSHMDRWIRCGAPIYKIDDCLAGQALLDLIEIMELDSASCGNENPQVRKKSENFEIQKYRQAATSMMMFLYNHNKDTEGCLPYRPNHKNGRIFADGIGMVVPFAMKYGIMFEDEDAIHLAINQINGFMKHGIDLDTGLPWHGYSLPIPHTDVESVDGSGEAVMTSEEHFGDLAWGRGTGWIMYGLGAAYRACQTVDERSQSPIVITARNILKQSLETLSVTILKYRRSDGLFGSRLTEPDSEVDTSASAMITYGLASMKPLTPVTADINQNTDITNYTGYIDPITSISPYITPDGHVTQAQGECMDFGQYGPYGSYPWSVGMYLVLMQNTFIRVNYDSN